MHEPKLSVVRAEIWAALARRLDEAALDPARAAAVEVLARPVRLLSLMAAEAGAALGDDVLAGERLRMLLYLAAPFASVVDEAAALDQRGHDDAEPAAAYEPGVLDHGGLALLALCAMRVASPGAELAFTRTVHGLALSAAPAEVLGRLVPRLPEKEALAVILDTLYLLDAVSVALRAPRLRPFANDPAERGRWRALSRLLGSEVPSAVLHAAGEAGIVGPPVWGGARAGILDDPRVPAHAATGDKLLFAGALQQVAEGDKLAAGLRVVFAAEGKPPVPAERAELRGAPSGGLQLRVVLPRDVKGGGWVGFSDDKLIERSNAFRGALREALPAMISHPGLRGAAVPAHLVAAIGSPDPARKGELLAVPPRAAGRPPIAAPGADGAAAATGAMVALPADTGISARQPRIVQIRAYQRDRTAPLYLGQPLDVEVILDAKASAAAILLHLDPPASGASPLRPDAEKPTQRFHFVVDAADARDGMLITAVLASYKFTDTRTLGPLQLRSPRAVRLVLVSPRVVSPPIARIDDRSLAASLALAERELGLHISPVQLPWVDDELAVLETPLTSGEDARVPRLLDALSSRAMLTPHLEDAIWVLVAPERTAETVDSGAGAQAKAMVGIAAPAGARGRRLSDGPIPGETFWRSAAAEAARAIAVANAFGLLFLLDELLPPEAKATPRNNATTRLRLVGTIGDGDVELHCAQQEERSAAAGAQFDSGLEIVTLDGRERELLVAPLRCLHHARPAALNALVPVSDAVVAVEVRHRSRTLARVARITGNATLKDVVLTKATPLSGAHSIDWKFHHTRNAHASLALALGFHVGLGGRPRTGVGAGPGIAALAMTPVAEQPLCTEVLQLDACEKRPALRLTRYGTSCGLQLLARDGWSVVSSGVDAPDGKPVSFENDTPVQIRKLSAGRYYADVPEGWDVRWTLGKTLLSRALVIETLPERSGTLRLEAYPTLEGSAAVVVDERQVEP